MTTGMTRRLFILYNTEVNDTLIIPKFTTTDNCARDWLFVSAASSGELN